MRIPTLALGLALLLGAAPSLAAQAQEPSDPVADAFQAWQDSSGVAWRLNRAPEFGGFGRFLWGGKLAPDFLPATDEDWFELARIQFDRAHGVFGLADATLEPVAVHHLALARIGTTDKVSVEFRQVVEGVPVHMASAHALFATDGTLLALDADAVPGVQTLSVLPTVNRWEAVARARSTFEGDAGMEAAEVSEPTLVVVRHRPGKFVEPRLAWRVEVRNEDDPARPRGWRYFVAADGKPEVLLREDLIHYQIQGHVESYATPGTAAGSASNPPAITPMRFMELTSGSGNVTTDANGDFTFSSGSSVTFTARYRGPWVRVENQAGANYSQSMSFTPGSPATMTMNTGQTEYVTSEASCFDSVVDVHEWLESVDPSDTTLDFQILANANLNSTCNAFYNGSSINMYRAGGGCNNTGYSTVVAHEEGHWANDLYGSGNGSDGFGEGNADVLAMYVYDTPIVGEDFFTNGGFIRTGNNTRQFCGDSNPGCYGQVHADGEVLMGALWKVRDRLNTTLGNAAGDLTADTLWVAWMNGFNDTGIRSIIEEHWLALDDNDGNIFNGTPNFGDIDGGFRDQGFPGVDLQLIDIVHTPLGDTTDEQGPYVVSADVTSLVGSTITGVDLVYSVDGGAPVTVAMANVGGNTWQGDIPGQVSPARVAYHLVASDALGNSERDPRSGEHEFVVGIRTTIYFNDFEGATDEGWTHTLVQTQDDWQRGTPQGKGTDPAAAYSGTKCWANDLGNPGWNGYYQPNVHNYLDSPSIDCSGYTGVTLRFARLLGVEKGIYDQAEILVNGVVVWSNPANVDLIDSDWNFQEVDISALADGNPNVTVRFQLVSDASVEFGGWNVDDFELYVLESSGGGNNDTITLTGPTAVTAGTSYTWSFSGAPASASYWLLGSTSNAGTVYQGHAFDVGQPVNLLDSGTTSGTGTGASVVFVPGGAAGITGYLEVAAFDGVDWFDSNLLTVDIL